MSSAIIGRITDAALAVSMAPKNNLSAVLLYSTTAIITTYSIVNVHH